MGALVPPLSTSAPMAPCGPATPGPAGRGLPPPTAAPRALIDERADGALRPGNAWTGEALLPASERLGGSSWGPGTVHVDAMDREGLTAALTPGGARLKRAEAAPPP